MSAPTTYGGVTSELTAERIVQPEMKSPGLVSRHNTPYSRSSGRATRATSGSLLLKI